ncbi:MAG: hypothetical protein ACT4QB_19110 [Gammaproteobacteria bacterium]
MDPAVARTYWDQIETRASLFLLINHEANPFRVKDLIYQSRRASLVGRAPYWMRKGYVEELVQFQWSLPVSPPTVPSSASAPASQAISPNGPWPVPAARSIKRHDRF